MASSSSISQDLYPSEDDLLYEEDILRNPFSLKLWWRYLIARSESPFKKRFVIYERALKALPGSYKLWHAYLRDRLDLLRSLPVTHSQYETLNNTFERALVTMHKMPRIWIVYLQTLTHQKLLTRTRRTFDRALRALPVTQHDRIWEPYLVFVTQSGVPIETSLRVYRRYLKYDPSHNEDFIVFLVNSCMWKEAAERLASTLNDDMFLSIKGKTRHELWLELCDLITKHANEVKGLNVDAIIRGGIRKFTDEVGRLWISLAKYYIRRGRGLHEKARDVFEEGMSTMKKMGNSNEEEEDNGEENGFGDDVRFKGEEFKRKQILHGFWLNDKNDIDLRFARFDYLMERRPELVNSVLLRQNPHNVEQWQRRVNLFEGNPMKQILTYTEAVRTIDPMKAVGKPHTLWVAFAKLYEHHEDLANARVIFDKAVQVNYKTVDNLASVWCEWAEMELRHNNSKGALDLMRRATAEPSVEVKRRVAADGNEPVQMKLHKSLRLWSFYVDLEESRGNFGEHKYFEDAFTVYERGVKIFKYPHVKDIWVTYLSKFVKRYGKTKLERARDLFENAIEMAPADQVKPLYLQYAKMEEDYGLAKQAMKVYDEATKAVPNNEKLSMYEIYIARASEIFGVPKTRQIYELAIQSGLPDKDVKTMCLKFAELEKSLGEIDRARAIYGYASQFANPRSDPEFWEKWHEFEVQHGNEDTFREMLRIKRSVSASYSQAGVHEDEMAALERQLAPATNDTAPKERKVGFVSAGVESQTDGGLRVSANHEDIELPEESDSDDEEKVEIAQKDVPSAVFGSLIRGREESEMNGEAAKDKDNESRLGALERIKRQKTK
ncbi:hypothetical protein PIB30_054207 [Stylosanthes scabra]|uniref:Uncharacterized protein n=1 Tax=Stylosanthes scabra TaxID=79078 RepID=A0ABU6SJG3_9FABA|nr:hypothetical protein [Stylosanthes scabra]